MATLTTTSGPVDKNAPFPVKRIYAWIVFALIFGLMLSDYLSRQVVNAVFPFLKAEWTLSDAQLGSLVSVVALSVGFLCVPFAMLADRYGRVKGITLMAMVWALATIACGFTNNFMALFIARVFVGLGEAGYGSAGAAVLVRVFPARLHSTVTGSFLAAAIFGSMLGVMIGGKIAHAWGWHASFIVIGIFGVVLAVIFPFVVKEPANPVGQVNEKAPVREALHFLLSKRSILLTYVAAGSAAFLPGAFLAWMPSYLNRYFEIPPDQAALKAGLMIFISGIGMVGGGIFADRFSRGDVRKRLHVVMTFGILAALVLLVAFKLPFGNAHFMALTLGMTIGSGFSGPLIAVIAKLVPSRIHATAFAMVTLAMSLLGLAPAPVIVGYIGDQAGLITGLYAVPVMCLVSALACFFAARSYSDEPSEPLP